jgi:hypothetical protein
LARFFLLLTARLTSHGGCSRCRHRQRNDNCNRLVHDHSWYAREPADSCSIRERDTKGSYRLLAGHPLIHINAELSSPWDAQNSEEEWCYA